MPSPWLPKAGCVVWSMSASNSATSNRSFKSRGVDPLTGMGIESDLHYPGYNAIPPKQHPGDPLSLCTEPIPFNERRSRFLGVGWAGAETLLAMEELDWLIRAAARLIRLHPGGPLATAEAASYVEPALSLLL